MAKRPLFHFPSRQASTALTSQNVTYQLSITRPDAVDTQARHQAEQQDPPCLTAQPRPRKFLAGEIPSGYPTISDGVTASALVLVGLAIPRH
jgi:hypothetical protein